MTKIEKYRIISALKTEAIRLSAAATTAQFSNERSDYADQVGETISLAVKLSGQWRLPLHNGAERFSELVRNLPA